MKLFSPVLLFVGRVLITESTSFLIISVFMSSVSHDLVLIGCMFLGIYLFRLSDLLVSWIWFAFC